MLIKKIMNRRIRQSWDDWTFDAINYTLLTLALIIVLYPLIFVVSASFSSYSAVASGRVVLWPVEPGLMAYDAVFRNPRIMIGYRNSLIYTLAGTALNVVMALLAAFPLSRRDLFGKSFLNLFFVFTMFFSGGLIPYFLLVKDTLRLYDTPYAIILPTMMSVWYVILMRTYIQSSIPEELIESAELDGCPVFSILWRIIVPLSKPIMAVIALYCAVAVWSSFFEAFIFIRSQNLMPLQGFFLKFGYCIMRVRLVQKKTREIQRNKQSGTTIVSRLFFCIQKISKDNSYGIEE